jgi:exodeoxyribonuclease-3
MMTTIKALSWNVNGIRAVQKKGFLEWFAGAAPDILCLQETKAHPEQLGPELLKVPGYSVHFSSAERKGYSGVALYTKQEPLEVRHGFGIREFDSEGRVVIADYGHFVLLNIYYPNGKQSAERLDYKMRFYDAFLDYVTGLKAEGRHLVICGDVNTAHREIDIARPKENSKVSGFLPSERAWVDKFLGHGYVDTFRMFNDQPGQYTWWDMMTRARDRNVGWRIDYFYVSESLNNCVKSAWTMPDVTGSDHCPIGVELELGE